MVIDPHVSEEAVDFTTDILHSNFHSSRYCSKKIVSFNITIVNEILGSAADNSSVVEGTSKRR
jgi:hypothetical protein